MVILNKKYRYLLGRFGEDLASGFLVRQGFTIIERNFRCQEGEIDIIAKRDWEWWFIEVKTRKSAACGEPEEACDAAKEEKMEAVALRYLNDKGIEIDTWQLGLISVRVVSRKKVKINFLVL
jgi:putative endonuclease